MILVLFGDIMMKALIFDIDNTLYSYDCAHKEAFGALTLWANEHLGLSLEGFQALHRQGDRLLRSHTNRSCAAVHNRLIRYQLMLEHIGQPITLAPMMARLYWSTLLDHIIPSQGVAECFAALKAANYTIGIGTDMTADYQFIKLERLGLLDQVDFMVSSEEAGVEKPDHRLFDLCVEKAGCAPFECVFVGDSLQKDVLGAQNAGLYPVWFCPDADVSEPVPEGAARIRCLAELPELMHDLQ